MVWMQNVRRDKYAIKGAYPGTGLGSVVYNGTSAPDAMRRVLERTTGSMRSDWGEG